MNKIKEIRKRLHLTQEKFGEGIDVEKSFICQLETGKSIPGRKIIAKICSAYAIDPREFFETDKKPVIKIKDPLIMELESLPTHDKDLLFKIVKSAKEISTEAKRDLLKHSEEKKLCEQVRKRRRKTA
ncbi:MAG: helix-turn-helix transcriptional regulator [Flavobacterium sp.]|nr:helix-turn-helix transcriptional regulator [Flavobacterium sp.]